MTDRRMTDRSPGPPGHDALIRDQFTRQADVFTSAAPISDAQALAMIVAAARPSREADSLDVACGGGLIVAALAPHVRRAVGVDLTPAMLARARELAAERGLRNVEFLEADAGALPFADGTFAVVSTRFSLHHMQDPLAVFREMTRVCARGGRIVVADMYASEEPAKAEAWNRLERMRDPSHVRALSLSELRELFRAAGLAEPEAQFYELRDEVRNLLARSFPAPGDGARITAMFAAQAEQDTMGIAVERQGDSLRYAYTVAILSAARA
jgi:ubiquinone/menaquinone biosynthesis C-methylase UbiE